jgi:hypothetical protein
MQFLILIFVLSGFYETQGNIWNQMSKLKDANEVVQGTVIGLLVKDPRLLLPKKKNFNNVKKQNDQLGIYSRNSNDLGKYNRRIMLGSCF